jgi:Domain of unknown function (DUF4037)
MNAGHLNDASRWRLQLGRGVAPAYSSDPAVVAVAVSGSVARGWADRHSDIELAVFWQEPPSPGRRGAAADRVLGVNNWRDLEYDADLDEWCDEYQVLGVKVDVSHRTVAGMERVLSEVLKGHDPSTVRQQVVAGVQVALPLDGVDLVERWQRTVEHYPDELARAMVESHLRFGPQAWLERLAERGEVLALSEIYVAATRAIFDVLLGLNRTYHPGYKWMDRTVRRMEVRPPELADRLRLVFGNVPVSSVRELERLIEDTLELVERHLPEVDTAPVRARIAHRWPVWEQPPPELGFG